MSAPVATPEAEIGEPDATGRFPISIPALVIEGLDTGDGRYIEPGALTHRALPLQILAQIQNPVNGDGHDGAYVIGQLEQLERVPGPTVISKETGEPFPEGTFVWQGAGWGTTQNEAGRLAQSGVLRGNSADIVEVRAELSMSDDGDERQGIQSGKIAATTLCPIPAFADSYVVVNDEALELPASLVAGIAAFRSEDLGDVLADYQGDETDPRCAPCAEMATPSQAKRDKAEDKGHAMPGGRYPIETAADLDNAISAVGRAGGKDGTTKDRNAVRRHIITQAKRLGLEGKIPDTWKSDGTLKLSLTASAYTFPPTSAFVDPEFAELTPIEVTEEIDGWRRIFGHIAPWGACHRGIRGRCETAPRSMTDYARFKLAPVRTRDADGTLVDVATGRVVQGLGHAGPYADLSSATYHYDNTKAVVADVNVGEDAHGIWIAGVVRRHVTDDEVHELRAAPPSGDWRPDETVGDNLELVAVLGVNTPGYAIARPAVREFTEGGKVTALVASIGPARTLPDGSPVATGANIDYEQLGAGVAQRLTDSVPLPEQLDMHTAVTIDYDVLAAHIKPYLDGTKPLPGATEEYTAEDEAADEAEEQAYAASQELRVRAAQAKLRLA